MFYISLFGLFYKLSWNHPWPSSALSTHGYKATRHSLLHVKSGREHCSLTVSSETNSRTKTRGKPDHSNKPFSQELVKAFWSGGKQYRAIRTVSDGTVTSESAPFFPINVHLIGSQHPHLSTHRNAAFLSQESSLICQILFFKKFHTGHGRQLQCLEYRNQGTEAKQLQVICTLPPY